MLDFAARILEAIAWPAVVLLIGYKFSSEIRTMIGAVNNRITQSRRLRVGNVEIDLEPQTASEQNQKIDEEISSALEQSNPQKDRAEKRAALTAKALTAENLAFRKLGAKYNNIKRNVKIGNALMDGVQIHQDSPFKHNTVDVFEIKYLANEKNFLGLEDALVRQAALYKQEIYKNLGKFAHIIFVFVLEDEEINIDPLTKNLADKIGGVLTVFDYSLSGLEAEIYANQPVQIVNHND